MSKLILLFINIDSVFWLLYHEDVGNTVDVSEVHIPPNSGSKELTNLYISNPENEGSIHLRNVTRIGHVHTV
jgi:hypothetical protein